jgi:hypothetical protein
MSDPDEITQIGIKHPNLNKVRGADLCVGSATEGDVGEVPVVLETVSKFEGKPGRGRPSKFTPEIKDELLRLIEDGTPIRTSCAIVGINTSTYQTWKGIAGKDELSDEHAFFIDIARARAIGEKRLLDLARQGDGRQWSEGPSKSAKWVLERSFGKDYAPRLNMKLEELGDLTLGAIERVCGAKDCGCYAEIIAALGDIETGSGEAV